MDKYNIPCRQKNLVALSSSPFNTYPISFGLLIGTLYYFCLLHTSILCIFFYNYQLILVQQLSTISFQYMHLHNKKVYQKQLLEHSFFLKYASLFILYKLSPQDLLPCMCHWQSVSGSVVSVNLEFLVSIHPLQISKALQRNFGRSGHKLQELGSVFLIKGTQGTPEPLYLKNQESCLTDTISQQQIDYFLSWLSIKHFEMFSIKINI